LQLCDRYGWTYAQWYALSENEQIDRLAYEQRRKYFLEQIDKSFIDRIDSGQAIEHTAYIMNLIELYAR